MKKRLFKRTISFLLASIMLFATATTALAKEEQPECNNEAKGADITMDTHVEVISVSVDGSGSGISTMDNKMEHDVIPANGTVDLYPKLESYIGLNKKFFVNTTSPSDKAGVFLYLYDPNGKLVSDGWVMGTNEAVTWSVFLPKSGTWRLYAVGHATEEYVEITAGWL